MLNRRLKEKQIVVAAARWVVGGAVIFFPLSRNMGCSQGRGRPLGGGRGGSIARAVFKRRREFNTLQWLSLVAEAEAAEAQ